MSRSATPAIDVRPARPDDAAGIARLADGLRAALGDPTGNFTPEAIRRDGFGPDPEFQIMVADRSGELVGYALYTTAYEPAYAAKGVYMTDLFVAEAARKQGVGRRLIQAVAADAKARGRVFVWWVAQAKNAPALAFYRKLDLIAAAPVVSHALLVDGG